MRNALHDFVDPVAVNGMTGVAPADTDIVQTGYRISAGSHHAGGVMRRGRVTPGSHRPRKRTIQ